MKERLDEKSRKTLWICLALTLLWILFIFTHSLQNSETSSQRSAFLWEVLLKIIPSLSHSFLRKLGHLAEFTVLGCLLGSLFRLESLPAGLMRLSEGLRRYVLPAYGGLVVAFCDEIIQTFVPGRSGEFRDVAIDFSGILLGIIMVAVFKRIRGRRFHG